MTRMLFAPLTPTALTLPDNQELTLALSATTIVNLTSTQALNIAGLFAVGGNLDGIVVCFSNVNSSAFSFSFLHDSGLATAPERRFRCSTGASITIPQYGAAWFRWSSFSSRWQAIGKLA